MHTYHSLEPTRHYYNDSLNLFVGGDENTDSNEFDLFEELLCSF